MTDLATARQAARIVGVSERRIRQLAAAGELTVAETAPLRVPVVECLKLRADRDAEDRAGGEVSPPGVQSLREIVAEVASAMLPAALEASRADRQATEAARDALRDRVESELREALAAALAAQKTAEARLAALEDELVTLREQRAAPRPRRWGLL